MSRQVTHQMCPETGYYVQIVSSDTLRRILIADGETTERPDCFGPHDEWDCGDEAEVEAC